VYEMDELIFSRADGSTRKVNGYKASKPPQNAKKYKTSRLTSPKLPPKIDLRKYMPPVEDQDGLGSCVANAVAGAYEYLVKRHKNISDYDVSRLFVYYNAREIEDCVDEDSGCMIVNAILGIQEKGACSEETWPYDIENFDEEPSEEAFGEAANFLVEDTMSVDVNLNEWKQALADGHPIIFGLKLFESFDSQRKPGLVPSPSKKESARETHSGHAMLCVGYSDKDKVFIVRNSWGESWGDEGYCYIPYDYLMNEKYNDGDTWVIKQLTNFELDTSDWGDETSVTGDYDTELAEMSDEDYEEMLDAMGDYALEFRIGLVILSAASADGDVSEEEYDQIATYMESTLNKIGVRMSAKAVLKNCKKELENEELFDESVALLGEYLSTGLLSKILNDAREIIGVDDLTEEEDEFLAYLTQEWQIEEEDDEEEDEEE